MPRMPKIPKIMKGGNFAATAPATMPGGMPSVMPGSIPLNYNTLMSNTMPGMPVNFQQLSQNIPIESKKGPDYILIGIIILFALIIGFSLYDTFSTKAENEKMKKNLNIEGFKDYRDIKELEQSPHFMGKNGPPKHRCPVCGYDELLQHDDEYSNNNGYARLVKKELPPTPSNYRMGNNMIGARTCRKFY